MNKTFCLSLEQFLKEQKKPLKIKINGYQLDIIYVTKSKSSIIGYVDYMGYIFDRGSNRVGSIFDKMVYLDIKHSPRVKQTVRRTSGYKGPLKHL